ncbi:MAG: hypothetical protein DMG63_17495 [Acidobacteria bacterium]|nr:MAG: hypothetical protein DMG63_17495 [Acidobacteriota bacterium]
MCVWGDLGELAIGAVIQQAAGKGNLVVLQLGEAGGGNKCAGRQKQHAQDFLRSGHLKRNSGKC